MSIRYLFDSKFIESISIRYLFDQPFLTGLLPWPETSESTSPPLGVLLHGVMLSTPIPAYLQLSSPGLGQQSVSTVAASSQVLQEKWNLALSMIHPWYITVGEWSGVEWEEDVFAVRTSPESGAHSSAFHHALLMGSHNGIISTSKTASWRGSLTDDLSNG